MTDFDGLSWPVSKTGELLQLLGRRSALSPRAVEAPIPPDGLEQKGKEELNQWIAAAANLLGLEVEPVEVPYTAVRSFLSFSAPALLRLQDERKVFFIALLGRRRQALLVLGPDHCVHRVPSEALRKALCQGLETPLEPQIDSLLRESGIPKRRRSKARDAILIERLSPEHISGCWLLRPSPSASFGHQLRLARLPSLLLYLAGAHLFQYLLWLFSWWLIGRGALEGRMNQGWLIAWALTLLTLVPFRLLVTWLQGVIAISAGGLLKLRLLYGAMRLEPEAIRHQGAGQLLGRVIESEAVEALALTGGFLALLAGLELVVAALILGAGAGGWPHSLLLAAWIVITLLIAWRYSAQRSRWTDSRLAITTDLVERMVGHRTRLAQEAPEHWHDGEDQALERYLEISRGMDKSLGYLIALVPRGWLFLGLIGVAPAFVSGSASQVTLALSLGGLLLAHQALDRLATGLSYLTGAAISWKQVAPFFHAASHAEPAGLPAFALTTDGADRRPALDAHDLVFRYPDRPEPALRDISLRLSPGERALLEGPSGSGKSTLAALLIGLRKPESGLLLLGGLDRQSLGTEGWRSRVVAAPQFHENHVLAETFAFNLLMGRRWPAHPEDFEEAEIVCRELGLGELLSRMPAGLLQLVGETGWQLSHGERSRLYIARALLQRADVIILDESFAALDPDTLRLSLRCVLNRAPTLLVIAHP